ncbi:hypothetical protein ACWDBD_32340 [Streptomyces sp. NPDC001118]
MAIPVETQAVLGSKIAAMVPHLDERQRPLYLAPAAKALGASGFARSGHQGSMS